MSHWVEYISRNSDKAVEDRKQELLDAELAKFMDGVLSSSIEYPRWF